MTWIIPSLWDYHIPRVITMTHDFHGPFGLSASTGQNQSPAKTDSTLYARPQSSFNDLKTLSPQDSTTQTMNSLSAMIANVNPSPTNVNRKQPVPSLMSCLLMASSHHRPTQCGDSSSA